MGRRQDALLQVRNLILYGLMSMVAMVILLWPLVSHILGYDTPTTIPTTTAAAWSLKPTCNAPAWA